jgi:hypothetical protein
MIRMKIYLILSVLSIFALIFIFNKAYYYGLGSDIVSKKLPDFIRPRFSGTDLGNNGFYFIEKDYTVHVIDNRSKVITKSGNEIHVNYIKAYGFCDNDIIMEVKDTEGAVHFLDVSYKKTSGYRFEEVKHIPREYNYINLDKSLAFFKVFKIIKSLLIIISMIFTILFIKALWGAIRVRLAKRNSV